MFFFKIYPGGENGFFNSRQFCMTVTDVTFLHFSCTVCMYFALSRYYEYTG